LGNKLTSFTDALFHAPTPERKIELANTFFLKQFASKLGNLAIADRINHTILDHKGFLSMDELAKQYSISPRHLRRIFKAETGISPKYYARLKRFEFTWFCANSGKFNWREFTGAHGFYDQAHLIREFKAFSGITPGKKLFDSNSIKYLEEQ
jgi:AraC-like DNA-binding protein